MPREPARYLVIQNDIRSKILESKLRTGDKLPSERELMDLYQVSRITAARALNDLVSKGLITRVAGKGSFVSAGIHSNNSSIDSIAPMDKKNIGFIIPTIHDSFSTALIAGIFEGFDHENYMMTIKMSGSHEREVECVVDLMRCQTAGIIIFPLEYEIYNPQILKMLHDRFPFVLLDRKLPGIQVHSVITDNRSSIHLALDHLVGLGHKRICFCTAAKLDVWSISERFTCFNEYIIELQDDVRPFFIQDIIQDYKDFNRNQQLVEHLKEHKCTAYITSDSNVALYLYETARALGLQIPEDFSVISFDSPCFAQGDLEFFTHIRQDGYKMGQMAASILTQQIEGKLSTDTYVNHVLTPELIVAKSTGPCY